MNAAIPIKTNNSFKTYCIETPSIISFLTPETYQRAGMMLENH